PDPKLAPALNLTQGKQVVEVDSEMRTVKGSHADMNEARRGSTPVIDRPFDPGGKCRKRRVAESDLVSHHEPLGGVAAALVELTNGCRAGSLGGMATPHSARTIVLHCRGYSAIMAGRTGPC